MTIDLTTRTHSSAKPPKTLGFCKKSLLFAALAAAMVAASSDDQKIAFAQRGQAEPGRARLAIIDSGVDNEHPALASTIWRNPHEVIGNGKDDDGNGYNDDIFGWNFADANALTIDRSYLGSFSPFPYRFFELQEKILKGTITEEEQQWMKDALAIKSNLKELQIFGNFVHGTHVAGIAAQTGPASAILALKIIPTQIKPPLIAALRDLAQEHEDVTTEGDPGHLRDAAIKILLFLLSRSQGLIMSDVGRYLHRQEVKVANGSFGVSARSAEAVIRPLLRIALAREPLEQELQMYCDHFVTQVTLAQAVLADSAKDTLLVFAAGNDGEDNDQRPSSPANIKRDNTISVAATYGNRGLAVFSNYGKSMVEIAAPGVAVRSLAPGGAQLTLSGTSQAAPFVAGIAAEVRAINTSLTPAQTKRIVLDTAEKMSFLQDKVATSGMVHRERALAAARLSLEAPLDQAVLSAFDAWPEGSLSGEDDVSLLSDISRWNPDAYITPLPQIFAPLNTDQSR